MAGLAAQNDALREQIRLKDELLASNRKLSTQVLRDADAEIAAANKAANAAVKAANAKARAAAKAARAAKEMSLAGKAGKELTETLKSVAKAANESAGAASGNSEAMKSMAEATNKASAKSADATIKLGALVVAGKKVSKWFFAISNGIMDTGKELVKLGLKAEEAEAKFQAVFRDDKGTPAGLKEATLAAEALAAKYGLADSSARKLIATTGDLSSALGLEGKRAAGLASMVAEYSGSLAQMNDLEGGAYEASQMLSAAMLGRTKRIQMLGAVVHLNSQRTRELTKQYERERQLTFKVARAMAILQQVREQSNNAQRFSTKASERATYWLRAFGEQSKRLKEKIGQSIIGTLRLAKVMQFLTKVLMLVVGMWDGLGKGAQQIIILTAIAIAGFTALIGTLVVLTVTAVAAAAGFSMLAAAIGTAALPLLVVIIGIVAGLAALFVQLAVSVGLFLYYIGEGDGILQRMGNGLKRLGQGLMDVIGFFWNFSENIEQVFTILIAYFTGIEEAFSTLIANMYIGVENLITAFTNIPAALKAAMKGGIGAGLEELAKGTNETMSITAAFDNAIEKEMERFSGFNVNTDDLKKGAIDLWKKGKDWLGTGGGAPAAPINAKSGLEGSAEAYKIITEAGSENDDAARNAASNEQTAINTATIARKMGELTRSLSSAAAI